MHTPHAAGHETEDATVLGVVVTLAGLAIGAGLVFLLVFGIFQYMSSHRAIVTPYNPLAGADQPQIPPPPLIEDHPAVELQKLHAQEDSILSSYGWTNKNAGIVHIPIDRAIDLQLQRGFPARKEPAKQ